MISTRKDHYKQLSFPLPSRNYVDEFMILEKRAVVDGDNFNVPNSIPPPHDRQVTGTGNRRNGWFESGPEAPLRIFYTCSLFHFEGHTSDSCPIRQMFID